jgi:hypothetical protein
MRFALALDGPKVSVIRKRKTTRRKVTQHVTRNTQNIINPEWRKEEDIPW